MCSDALRRICFQVCTFSLRIPLLASGVMHADVGPDASDLHCQVKGDTLHVLATGT